MNAYTYEAENNNCMDLHFVAMTYGFLVRNFIIGSMHQNLR